MASPTRLALTILACVVTGISSAKVDLSVPRGRAASESAPRASSADASARSADASATHAAFFSALSALHSGVIAVLANAEGFETLATPLITNGGQFSSHDAPSLLHNTNDALWDTANASVALARVTLRILRLLDPVAAARLEPPASVSASSTSTPSPAVSKSDDATYAKRKRASPGAPKGASRMQQPAVAPGALTDAARTNASAEVIEGLLARGADVREVDEVGPAYLPLALPLPLSICLLIFTLALLLTDWPHGASFRGGERQRRLRPPAAGRRRGGRCDR